MADTLTLKTLKEIEELGNNFRAGFMSAYTQAAARYEVAHHYIKIHDPAYPDDPTKRVWHPNMLVLYSATQLSMIESYYNHVVADYMWYKNMRDSDPQGVESMFDVVTALNTLVASSMGPYLAG